MSMSNSDTVVSVPALLKKTEHYDKDERYMATSDLCEVLKRGQAEASASGGGSTMDAAQERQICTAVLRLLHDKSNDVQAIAVKTLSVLLTTVQQEQVLEIADSLADQVLDASKSELRDVYAIGLRTLVKTIPTAMGERVSQRLVGRLLDGIRTSSATTTTTSAASSSSTTSEPQEEIVLACLDILTEVLHRFGATSVSVTRQHEPAMQLCLSQLMNAPTTVVRKRAGNTLACLSTVLADPLLHRMVEALLQQIDVTPNPTALIRTMCTVSGFVGHRLGQEQIDRMVPIFLRFTNPEQAVTGDDDDDDEDAAMEDATKNRNAPQVGAGPANDELRESCFMGFESFVARCPKEIEPHLDKILQAALAYMSYDPNYSYGDVDDDVAGAASEDDEDLNGSDDEEEEPEDDDDEDEDDDDETWKVRRSAIRALKAVVQAKKHDTDILWIKRFPIRKGKSDVVAGAILSRFKEREENCRVEIIDCFTQLLVAKIATYPTTTLQQSNAMETDIDTEGDAFSTTYAPRLVKACEKILAVKKGNERSKSCALNLLATLCQAPGGIGNADAIASVFKHIQVFLATSDDKQQQPPSHSHTASSKALRLDALTLVHAILASPRHHAADMRDSLRTSILPQLCLAVKEQWYKVIAEALRALASVPRLYIGVVSDECQGVAKSLYEAIEPLLGTHDVDQEIKECALRACGALLSSNLQSYLTMEQKGRLLQLLLERLQNETTRITAMKTLSCIAAAAPAGANLEPILAAAVTHMASFLKLQSRSLKQTCLETLDVVVLTRAPSLDVTLYQSVLMDLAPLIVPNDLHLTNLSLRVTVSILKVCPAAGPAVKTHVLEHALNLSTSSLLQDQALESLLSLFQQIILSNAVEFKDLLQLLQARLTPEVSKPGIYNLAECIAVIASATTMENTQLVLADTLRLLEDPEAPPREVQLKLLVSGDLGRMVDLGTYGGDTAERLVRAYVRFFDSPVDDLTHAAAYALGNASVRSKVFLQEIVHKIDERNKKQQYLVLSALREFIKCGYKLSKGDSIVTTIPLILPPLEKHCGDEEEGVRTMVAECLGSLTCLQPDEMFSKLEALLIAHEAVTAPGGVVADDDEVSKTNARVCWTIASAIKLAIAGKVDPVALARSMPVFVRLLKQEELSVRTAALLMVYSAAHHMPQVLSGLLKDDILPELFVVAKLKLERKVDLGPFTHTVDDALPLRKAALSIYATCLENLPVSIDVSSFMPILARSLGDAEDIQLHAHQIVISMGSRQPTYLVASIDSFVEPLEKTLNKKPGQKTGTELERLNDWIKSALRVVVALSKLEGAMNSRKFADFLERTKANAKFAENMRAIQDEH